MSKVMIFGVFDGLHKGHEFFISEAKKCGDKLIIVVTRDKIVELLKNKKTRHSEMERQQQLANCEKDALVVLGDSELSTYKVVNEHQPDVICLGYDQDALAADLRDKIKAGATPEIKLVKITPHEPKKYHSSLLL